MDEIRENVTEREHKSSLARESLFPFQTLKRQFMRDLLMLDEIPQCSQETRFPG